jgi:metallo-beta-lactamase family protein
VVHYLQKWILDGKIPHVPIFVDSPLVADIVEVYRRHPHLLPADGAILLETDFTISGKPGVHYIRTWDESRAITRFADPCVIVASGGMLDAGRALYHLQHYIDDPRCSIALVSYQAPHSLGARLLQKGPTVYFLGKGWNKWADVVEFKGFSGHADQNDFLALLTPLAGQTGKVRLVHGEPDQAEALAASLRERGFSEVAIPDRDDSVSLA